MRNRKRTKLLALVLSVVMCINSVNLSVFAEESTEVIEETVEMTTSEASTENSEENTEVSTESGVVKETASETMEEETESESAEETNKTEDIYEGDHYKVTFVLSSQWEGGYNANVQIENTGDTTIENWYVSFEFDNVIANIWNADIENCEDGNYVIKNAGWNADIPVGGSVQFGFGCNENFADFPQGYTLLGESTEADENDYTVEYIVDSDWGSGFTGRISITNNTDVTLEDWVLEFDFERELTSVWDASIESYAENHYVIKNAGWNADIAAGQTLSFGFNGQGDTSDNIPQNYILTSYKVNIIDPMKLDSDEDGLPDGYESSVLGTDLQKMDSDDNGTEDGKEDFDNDNLENLEEFLLGTNPFGFDTDDDGFSDKYEDDHGMNPLVYDEIIIDSAIVAEIQDYTIEELVNLNIDEYYPLEIEYNDEQTQVTSISGVFSGQKVDSPLTAIYSIYNIKTLLGLNSPEKELKFSKLFYSKSGISYIFIQYYKGVEIYGRSLTVSVDNNGKVTSINSSIISNNVLESISVVPQITEELLHTVVHNEYGNSDITSVQLVLYIAENSSKPQLAYICEVSDYESIIISANSGNVINKFKNVCCERATGTGVDEKNNLVSFPVNQTGFFAFKEYNLEDIDRKIKVYDCSNGKKLYTSMNNFWLDCTAISAYMNVIKAYDWWKSNQSYWGIDGSGETVDVFIHDPTYTKNAFYSPSNPSLHFCDNSPVSFPSKASALDCAGHEYTHAVVDHKTSMTTNAVMASTIDEAYADIFGSIINNNTWRTLPRDIANPNKQQNPSFVGGVHYVSGTTDPHKNSTIISHAAYLMNTTYNFSFDKLDDLWYGSLGEGFDDSADFNTVRTNVIKSARKNKFTYEEIANIRSAFDAVGVYGDKGNANIMVYDGGIPVVDAKISVIFYNDYQYQKTDTTGIASINNLNVGLNTVKLEIIGREPIYTHIMVEKGQTVSKTINILTSLSNFTWDEYDHYNYSQPYVSAIPKHIVFSGNDIKMIGYTVQPFKDFLLTNGNDDPTSFVQASQKILSFNIKRDKNNWHTIEGGGFLFNVDIINNALYGHCILVTSQGLRLYEIKGADIEKFRNGALGDISSIGLLLGTYDIGDVLDNHKITLRISDDNLRKQISLWDGDKLIIENLELVNCFGEDFGPITSHTSHYCGQVSYFTFSDIQMSSIQ